MKNALQAQLLKAGLVGEREAKKINRQQNHAKKTGDNNNQALKQDLERANAEKIAHDQALNQEKQLQLELKARSASVKQMLTMHHISPIMAGNDSDVLYQFVDATKIKKIYLTPELYKQVVKGNISIAKLDEQYLLLPYILAEKIASHEPERIIVDNRKVLAESAQKDTIEEEDPYASYVIPDDLMW